MTIKDFTTNHKNLVGLLSVATYGNGWPIVKAFKSDAEKGLFEDCECREDKWAEGLLHGKGIMVYDLYEDDESKEKHHLTIADVENGLKLMRDRYPRHYADLMTENDDLITGDVWLQLATFGELIYG